ncbi:MULTISPECIES: copper resistance protein NlpE N-terminal domain-containing protein [Acinetobacter]|uniref:copper resistance protein NlpE N-terminal domain-containing protein n=1 Tax=Acinetobacter TaxID=469 RepID=UPI0015B6A4A7|nr:MULTISPECIES: copper resistance protein NlpE N-terminal domain-containing protein [Acinetobacter]MBT0885733.1 copper resistance protein NlpE N-terminal domain-containing protein [Acinetobacter towneri]NWJ91140.1 copper resistance protein NlpE N-terminal domain-containing protein [Acinetobacter sp. Swhac1]
MLNRYPIALSTLSLLLAACGSTEQSKEYQANLASEPPVAHKTESQKSATSWSRQATGNFIALLPCDHCEQHVIHLRLNDDQTFQLSDIKRSKQRQSENQVTGTIQAAQDNKQREKQNQHPSQTTIDEWLLHTENVEAYARIQLTTHGLKFNLYKQRNIKNQPKIETQVFLHPVESIKVSNALKHVDIQAEHVQNVEVKELNDPVMAHDYFLAIHNQSNQALQLHANDLVLVDQQYQEYAAVVDPKFLEPIPAQQKQWIKVSFHYPTSVQADVIKIK